MVYLYLPIIKKIYWSTNIFHNLNEIWQDYAKLEKPVIKKKKITLFDNIYIKCPELAHL